MKWLKRWIRSVANGPEPEGYDMPTTNAIKRGRNTPAEEMLAQMASSVAVVFRIDNGFMVGINMIDHTHIGQRGKLLYAKDAQEVAERMIAHETAFKIGVREGGGLSGQTPDHGPARAAYILTPKDFRAEYPTPKKGNWKYV